MESRTCFCAMVGAVLLFTTMSATAQAPAPAATDVKPSPPNCRPSTTGKSGWSTTPTIARTPPITLSVTCGERAPVKDEKAPVKDEGSPKDGFIPAVDPPAGASGQAKEGNNEKTEKHLSPDEVARFGILGVGGALCLASILLLVTTVTRATNEEFVFRRHWGGFGDAVTGWHASPALIRVIAALVLGVLGVLVLSFLMPNADKKPSKEGSEAGGKAPITALGK